MGLTEKTRTKWVQSSGFLGRVLTKFPTFNISRWAGKFLRNS